MKYYSLKLGKNILMCAMSFNKLVIHLNVHQSCGLFLVSASNGAVLLVFCRKKSLISNDKIGPFGLSYNLAYSTFFFSWNNFFLSQPFSRNNIFQRSEQGH